MRTKKINFVLNGFESYSIKRMEEFVELGYDVKAYGFDRGLSKPKSKVEIQVIGQFPISLAYFKRVKVIHSALRNLFKDTHKSDEEIWYYFGLQVALFSCRLNKNKKYLYEESDMTHLGVKNRFIREILETANKSIIRKSRLSVFTSEGFLQFHFGAGSNYPNNVIVMPNKIRRDILKFPVMAKSVPNPQRLRFAFVGFIRYNAVFNMADIISKNFPQHEFHFYGEISNLNEASKFRSLEGRENVFFHGSFKNPDKLPEVYSNIDVVISTYDVSSINVLYAEPNKLYESIYFRTPIIVSEGTFLARQVSKYHSGWAVNAFEEKAVCNLVATIEKEIVNVREGIETIPMSEGVDDCEALSFKLRECNL